MDTDSEPPGNFLLALPIFFLIIDFNQFILLLLFFVLLIGSALMSGAETAFTSLSIEQLRSLENENSPTSRRILFLKKDNAKLLTTIQVGNYIFNIALILILEYISRNSSISDVYVNWSHQLNKTAFFNNTDINVIFRFLSFGISISIITIILVLFGEVMPKIYASFNGIRLARIMALPVSIVSLAFGGLITLLQSIAQAINKIFDKNRKNFNLADKEELEDALDTTLNKNEQELDILKSILNFNDVAVKQIMKPRTEVIALSADMQFTEVLNIVKECGYSRIPVFEDDFDRIIGILFAKDLIPFINQKNDFNWLRLIRKHIYYVPESKKINEILKEFQKQKTHMAIVVDEYGGSSGLVTMEDIMEEILGDILDEFDEEEEEMDFMKLDNNTYIFEGKTSLLDFIKVFDSDPSLFDDIKGESDSLAGTLLEIAGEIPPVNYELVLDKFKFIVEKTSERRIEKIKVIVNEN